MKKFELTEEQLVRLIEVGMEIITDFKATKSDKKIVTSNIIGKLLNDIEDGLVDVQVK
jgi:hypothetical protein